MHFYLCFLPVDVFAAMISWPGPIRVDLGVTWLAKWRGACWILCYTKILLSRWCKIRRLMHTFHALLSEQKYIPCNSVNHTIVPFWCNMMGYTSSEWSYKPWWLILNIFWYDNVLGMVKHVCQVTWFAVMACLTVKMVQITDIYPYFHMLHSEIGA